MIAQVPFSEKFKPTRTSTSDTTSSINNVTAPLKPQRNDKLRVAWHGLGNTRARRTNTAKRAPNMYMTHRYVRAYTSVQVPFSGKYKPTRTSPSDTTSSINNVTAPLKPQRNDKLRVAWHGLGNTRARRTNTAKRAPNMNMTHRYVRVHVCTVSIK